MKLITCSKLFSVLALLVGASFFANAAHPSRVFIQFKPGQKAAAENVIGGAGGEIHFTFNDLEAVAATIPDSAIAGIQRNPNIVLVEPDPQRFLFTQTEYVPYGIDMIQATAIWDANNDGVIDPGAPTGAGIKIGVIDSGVFAAHTDFAGVSMTGYPTGWNSDGLGHGTHVSGTIAAALNGDGVVGVSPGKVAVHMVKVFGDDGAWIYASTLLDAANKCRDAGCKIISMSLGGGLRSVTEERGFQNLEKQGILSIAAAGNGGNKQTSYPAGYGSVVSVAAIDQSKQAASFSQQNKDVELAAPGVGVLSTVPYIDNNTVTITAPDGTVSTVAGGHIENAVRTAAAGVTGVLIDGGRATSTNPSWVGKVVLVERGDVAFYDKVRNVENSGGLACVIYNNVPGDFSGTLGDGMSSGIPAISLSQANGQALLASFGQSSTVVSTLTKNVSGYAYYDGTSMATPHVSAAAALIWSAAPAKSNAQIRAALQATAEDLGVPGRDTVYGYGLIRAKLALQYLLSH